MRPAVITLLILALVLTGLGVFGISDYIRSMPGVDAARRDTPKVRPPEGTVGGALQDYLDSLDRSRTIALVISLLCLVGGLGLGAWAGWKYFHPHSFTESGARVCNICGAKLLSRQVTQGLCDICQRRTE